MTSLKNGMEELVFITRWGKVTGFCCDLRCGRQHRVFFFRRFGQSTLSLDIAIKELILVVIAAKLWGYDRCLLFRNGLMQNRHLAFILREPTIFAITNSFTFTATRIEGLQIEELMLCLALS